MNIEIFSDLICPWCFIGKKRFDLALRAGAGEGVKVIWRAFQLYPGIPQAGMSREEFSKARYGENDQRAGRAQIEQEAEKVGLDMAFNRIDRMPNTFNGHRLVHLSRQAGVQHELVERLFTDYFERGRDVGSDQVLLDAAESCGLDRTEITDYLHSDQGADAVGMELERASNIGVTGVPCFIFAGAFALPGAQEPEVIAQVIERARVKLADAG